MKKVIALFFCILLAASVSVAFSADSATLYKTKCSGCHGIDGTKHTGGIALAGLDSSSALEKMNGYLDGSYGGKAKGMMTRILKKLDASEIPGLAEHIGTFK
ncbi:c-type cytochrome [Maridesulfovibrio bastinii]|uniref:c-type cytochrome n=1 Tax=Maridesulfovibrio bastinii TaxID=47157 RepID=UPI00041DEF68|nr:c-type cytochrome [Maridesulfovibrio bastinii]